MSTVGPSTRVWPPSPINYRKNISQVSYNSKDSHKVRLSRILTYYVELQVLDISIVSERLEITTQCVRSFLTVRNDDRVCTHFGLVLLERMTGLISLMTCTSAFLTRMFLWWRHRVIQICVLRFTHTRTLCGMQKIVCREVYLLEIIVPRYFMIGWWMVLRKIIRPVMYSLFPIGI